jgi:hypothetical protein
VRVGYYKDWILFTLGDNMKNVGTLIFLLLLAMIGANILHSTESELVSIKAYVRNQKGKISEIKNFKKSKTLKVDGIKQQLSHFSIVLRIQIYDADTIYYENDILLFVGKNEDIHVNIDSKQLENKKLRLKITGFEEFDGDIMIEKVNTSNGNRNEGIYVQFKTSYTYSAIYNSNILNGNEMNLAENENRYQGIDDIQISGKINDIEIIGIQKGMEVYRKGPFCLSGSINIKLYNPDIDWNQQQELNKTSDKKDLVNLIIKQKNKVIYNGYSYFKE